MFLIKALAIISLFFICGRANAFTYAKAQNIGTANAAAATISVTGVNVPAHSLIVVCISDTNGSVGTMADNAGNTYTKIVQAQRNGTGSTWGAVFYTYNASLAAAQNITYTASGAATANRMSAFYVTGIVYASNPLDSAVTASAVGSSALASVTSGTPTGIGDFFVGCIADGTATFTQDTNHAWETPPIAVSVAAVAGGSYQHTPGVKTALTYAPSITSTTWAAFIVGFKTIQPGLLLQGVP